jgi:transcriptional regulator with XRE-family HTH domain
MSRLNAGLSQTELGEKVGVTFQQIQKYEKGSNKCPVVTLREIGYITKANMPWLFGFEECI